MVKRPFFSKRPTPEVVALLVERSLPIETGLGFPRDHDIQELIRGTLFST
jgi:hypothetical protein